MMGRHFTGAGVDTDTKKAMELWESAAAKGDTEAIYLLGLCYTGIGAGEGENVTSAHPLTHSRMNAHHSWPECPFLLLSSVCWCK